MDRNREQDTLTSLEALQALYDPPREASLVKEADRLTPDYGRLIQASPFLAIASTGPAGLDCSPRGDRPGFVTIADEKTLLLPDRQGNNRLNTLRNIVSDPRIALLFLIPGLGITLRVSGQARISIAPDLLNRFAVEGKPPRSVLVIAVERVYFQCARAILRSHLWDPAQHMDPKTLPTPGEILAHQSESRLGGPDYDETWTARAKKTLW